MRASSTKRHNAGGERARAAKSSMVSVPEGLILGASGLVSRQMKRGERGSVPASAARLNARPADATLRSGAKNRLLRLEAAPALTAGPKNLMLSS